MAQTEQRNHETDERSLRALEEIENNPGISQRDLSTRLGVALGITNSLIKTLARKGLIKVRGDNNRSLTYHLTKAGVLHKGKLALQWTLNTIGDYRRMRGSVQARLAEIAATGAHTVVLCGANELAEIAAMVAAEAGAEVLGVADGDTERQWVGGYQVSALAELLKQRPDALVSCYEDHQQWPGALREAHDSGLPVHDLLAGD